jgi:hypothetical protein
MIDVYLNDRNMDYDQAQNYFQEACAWAQDQCSSFTSFYIQDVSDVSYEYDQIAQYIFADEKDAQWFSLKWK